MEKGADIFGVQNDNWIRTRERLPNYAFHTNYVVKGDFIKHKGLRFPQKLVCGYIHAHIVLIQQLDI